MIKFAPLATRFISFASNGVLGHIDLTRGIEEITLVHPGLIANIKKPADFILELSRALRTLLSWFRDFKKGGQKRAAILRNALSGDEAVLEAVVEKLVLINKVIWAITLAPKF